MTDEKTTTDAVKKLQEALAAANQKAAGLSKSLDTANRSLADLNAKLEEARAQVKEGQKLVQAAKTAEAAATRRADLAEGELAATKKTIAMLENQAEPEAAQPTGTVADAIAAGQKKG